MYLQKVISKKILLKKLVFCSHLEGQWRKWHDPDSGSGSISQRHGSADPDPLQNVMDPEHWIFPSWWDVRQKSAIATLCVLCVPHLGRIICLFENNKASQSRVGLSFLVLDCQLDGVVSWKIIKFVNQGPGVFYYLIRTEKILLTF